MCVCGIIRRDGLRKRKKYVIETIPSEYYNSFCYHTYVFVYPAFKPGYPFYFLFFKMRLTGREIGPHTYLQFLLQYLCY